MKRFSFGTPDKFVPSMYCKSFNYTEGEVKYDSSKISFKVNHKGCVLEFPLGKSEHIYGLGLQLGKLDFRGSHVKLKVNSDPPGTNGESHAPVPFFASTAGYGIYFDTARYIEFDFGRTKNDEMLTNAGGTYIADTVEDLYSAKATENQEYITAYIPFSKGIDIYIFEGETITDVVSEYNMLSGGGCEIPEWGLGLYYRCYARSNQEQVMDWANYFRNANIPCSVLGLEPGWHTRCYPCSHVWNQENFPDAEKMVKDIHAMGYHMNLWQHSYLHPTSPLYYKLKPYSANYTVWNGLVPDFSYPEVRTEFANHYKNQVHFGLIDGCKMDECDHSDYKGGWCFPDYTEFPSGMDGDQFHCLFGTFYMQTMLEAFEGKPTYSLVRTAGALNASYPFVLYSDLYNHRDFVRGIVTSGFSGLLWTPEIRYANSKDELMRRAQSLVFSAMCLINFWNQPITLWLKYECEDEFRDLINLRESLKPMLMKAFDEYQKTGKAPIRALVSDYTSDPETYAIDDQYIFCDNLVVAPIIVGDTKRRVYLPEGNWVNYFTREPQASGWFEVETENIPVYEKV